MSPRLFASVPGDPRGTAALEFALVSPLLIMMFTAMTDAVFAYHAKIQISEAVDAGVQYALLNAQSITGSPASFDQSLQSFVADTGSIPSSSVSVAWNNNLTATSCYCVSGTAPTYSGPYTCGATCSGSSETAGKFVAITASFSYMPIFPADKFFMPGSLTEKAIVRVQ